MKRKILLIICLMIGFSNCKALEMKENSVITNKNIEISISDYNKLHEILSDETIDTFDEKMINAIVSSKNIVESKLYEVTTYEYSYNGEIISENTAYTDENIAKAAAKNDIYVTKNGEIQFNKFILNGVNPIVYSTSSKEISSYGLMGDKTQVIVVHKKWFKLPTIRQFDIVALRWNNAVDPKVISVSGTQTSDEKTTNYDIFSKNVKTASNGCGVSINLHDNAKNKLQVEMTFFIDGQTGKQFYVTYQHAKHSNANSLAIAKSYKFKPEGLGGVVYFANTTYRSYYDGMKGLELNF